MNDRRSLTIGVVLLLLGAFFLLSRTFDFSGPGVILALIGAIFLALSAVRGMRGPLLPGGILLGRGFSSARRSNGSCRAGRQSFSVSAPGSCSSRCSTGSRDAADGVLLRFLPA
ncbi:MAG TPA: hypothetical protein VGS98_09900 [Thermoanaerobaculia bacterium]|nr:hypothetical protein [Thermoanaerobaculia bacterium]